MPFLPPVTHVVPAGVEHRVTGCKSVTFTTEPRLFLEISLYKKQVNFCQSASLQAQPGPYAEKIRGEVTKMRPQRRRYGGGGWRGVPSLAD